MMSDKLLDVETLFDALMTDAAPPGVTPIQWLHADTYDQMPFASWQVVNNGQYSYGLWNVTLILEVVTDTVTMHDVCSQLYAGIKSWAIPGQGVVPDVGFIENIEDQSVFDKSSQGLVQGKFLSQASATFSISVRVT